MIPLPIDDVLPACQAAVRAQRALVLTAAPGAGKSTRLPPALLSAVAGQVVVLQPRRVAARAVARRIAEEQGWQLGREVGFQVRHERVGSRATRLWLMTEGVLTRRLLDDPFLEGVGCVVLDEFHERSQHTDLALAWVAELRRTVRDDLAVVVMSATMDAAPVCAFLGAPHVDCAGRAFPIAIRHEERGHDLRLAERVAAAVRDELTQIDGDLLAFLPGAGEIRACQDLLDGIDADVLPLHGQLPGEEQDRAVTGAPAGGRRRVVLATNVAETSLTVPGVRGVIDGGQARVARYDADRGLDTLLLEPISRANADQRAGRAGRLGPGRCVRLWSRLEDQRRSAQGEPELARVDLAGTLLTLARLGVRDAAAFPWFEPPPDARVRSAQRLLARLGAIDAAGALTEVGSALAALPLHPRLGRLLLAARAAGAPRLGATLAALLDGRDLRPPARRGDPPADPGPADVLDRIDALATAERARFHHRLRDERIDPQAAREAARNRDELSSDAPAEPPAEAALVARLILTAYPDRIGRRSAPDSNRVALMGCVAAEIASDSCLFATRGTRRGELVVLHGLIGLGGRTASGTAVQARLGAEIDEALISAVLPGEPTRRVQVVWNEGQQRVDATVGWWCGDLCLRVAHDAQADPAALAACLADHLAPQANAVLGAHAPTRSFLERLRWLALVLPGITPPDAAALAQLMRDLCAGCRTRAEVAAKDPLPWLHALVGFDLAERVDRLAPERWTVPTGNRLALDYSAADATRGPVLAVRLQELFGEPATPRIVDGRVGVLLHLLGPNYRVEQVTGDLASFWANTYPQVRKDLRGRYPKHSWPEDPLTAPPVAKGRPVR